MYNTCQCSVKYYSDEGKCYCCRCDQPFPKLDKTELTLSKKETYLPIFVYGTLKPDFPLAYSWQNTGKVQYHKEALIFGTMFDTGSFPAITTRIHKGGCNVVSGYLLYPKSIPVLNQLLRHFDIIEGVSQGLYKRVQVKTNDLVDCYTYVWGSEEELPSSYKLIHSGVWR